MCGHVGLASLDGATGWKKRANWMTQALLVDSLRGTDGTGLCCVPINMNNAPVIYKKGLPSWDFLQLKMPTTLIQDADKHRVMIGHNRATTLGASNDVNAHPFNSGGIYLAHNGTLNTFNGLDDKFSVDSEAICEAINRKGAAKVLPELNGAFALVWYDATKHTLNFARNDERDFYFSFSKDMKSIFWASEAWMITEIAARKKIELDLDQYMYQLVPGKHVEISFDQPTLDNYNSYDFKIYETVFFGKGSYGKSKYDYARSLKYYGYKYDEKVLVKVESFAPYPGKNDEERGTITGKLVHKDGYNDTVKIYYTLRGNSETKYMHATVKSVYTEGATSPKIILTCTDPVAVSIKEARKEIKEMKKLASSDIITLYKGPRGMVTKEEWDRLTKHGCAMCNGNVESVTSDYIEWTDDGRPVCTDCSQEILHER